MGMRKWIRERLHEKEKPDPTPVSLVGREEKPLTLREEMQRYIQQQLSPAALEAGAGSFEDEDDFEEDDPDPDLTTPYTVHELRHEMAPEVDDLEGAPNNEDMAAKQPEKDERQVDIEEVAPPAEPPLNQATG